MTMKLQKNSIVCTIQDKTSVDKLENELSQINNDIFAMQKKRSEISLFRDDIKNANLQIEKIVDENIYLCSQNDIDKINNFLSSLQNNIDLRNQILLTENHGNVKEMSEKIRHRTKSKKYIKYYCQSIGHRFILHRQFGK